MADRDVKHIHLGKLLAIGSDDVVGVVTAMLDADGDRTETPADAMAVTVKWPDGVFASVDLSGFDWSRRHGPN